MFTTTGASRKKAENWQGLVPFDSKTPDRHAKGAVTTSWY